MDNSSTNSTATDASKHSEVADRDSEVPKKLEFSIERKLNELFNDEIVTAFRSKSLKSLQVLQINFELYTNTAMNKISFTCTNVCASVG